jgi:hypothetical protein
MNTEEANIGKLEAQLSHWGAKLDELVGKVEEGALDAKTDYRKHIDDLKVKHDVARKKLEEFKVAGSEKWMHFKVGIEGAWGELEDAFKSLKL